MAEIIDARVKQKTGTAADFAGFTLLEGEIALVRSTANGPVINYTVGPGLFDSLPWSLQVPGTVASVSPSTDFSGLPAGLYLPDSDGTYDGTVSVDLTEGVTYLNWDGSTLTKQVYPINLAGYEKNLAESIGASSTFLFDWNTQILNVSGARLRVNGQNVLVGNGGAVSWAGISTDTVIIAYKPTEDRIVLVAPASAQDTPDLKYLGYIRKVENTINFSGLFTVNGSRVKNFTASEMQPTVYSLGSPSTIDIKFSTDTVVFNNAILLHKGSIIQPVTQTLDFSGTSDDSVAIIMSNDGTLSVVDITSGAMTAEGTKIVGILRKSLKQAFINGMFSIDGSVISLNDTEAISLGSPTTIIINLTNETVNLSNAIIKHKGRVFPAMSKSMSFSSISDNSIVLCVEPFTGDVILLGVTNPSVSRYAILGMFRKDNEMVFLNGLCTFNGQRFPVSTRDLVQHTAYSISRKEAVVIDWGAKTITFTGVYIKYKGVNRVVNTTVDWNAIASTHIIIGFNTATNQVQLAGLTTAEDTTSLALIGYIRPNTKEVYFNGQYSEVGGIELTGASWMFRGGYNSTLNTAFPDPQSSSPMSVLLDIYDGLVSAFPDRWSKTLLGQDDFGYDIFRYDYTYRMNQNQAVTQAAQKDRIIVTTGTHGYEKRAALSVAVFLYEMTHNTNNDEFLRHLRNSVKFTVIPIVTPSAWVDHSRKNRNGVDINRNFVTGWVLGNPSDDDYGGPEPLSEKESQYVKQVVDGASDAFAAFDRHSDSGYSTNGYAGWGTSHSLQTRQFFLGFAKWANSWLMDEEGLTEQTIGGIKQQGVFRLFDYSWNRATVESYFTEKGLAGVILETDTSIRGDDSLANQKLHSSIVGNLVQAYCTKYLGY